MTLLLIGDSDIARWPPHLYPAGRGTPIVSGHIGATLDEVINRLETCFETLPTHEQYCVVFCAGENDLGEQKPRESIAEDCQRLLTLLYDHTTLRNPPRLLFLGPKLEPWLIEDRASRTAYIRLSSALQRTIEPYQPLALYMDCLTMFCGESGQQPGALLGGKARAELKYFDGDGLHLSEAGYMKWKEVVESWL